MESLKEAIQCTPIIDHHAHNLLISSKFGTYDLLSIFTEANGPAMQDSTSTLAHKRAVKQLSGILHCKPEWEIVRQELQKRHNDPDNAWTKTCFTGIETVLIDDGLNQDDVEPYEWHNNLTRSKCKRILRIEKLLEQLMELDLEEMGRDADSEIKTIKRFKANIEKAIADPEVAGFKSVICYRTGLAIPSYDASHGHLLRPFLKSIGPGWPVRLQHDLLNPFFVHLTTHLLQRRKSKKPFQFHTGLGDNDINLHLSNPAHMQQFIATYPDVNIVLLHGSYPFTAEAGYLASVYNNVFLDIGEVFPFVSQDGQERVISESLELCPSTKLLWSTDGHWFPETYLLAVIQMREGLYRVLNEYVHSGALTVDQSITIVHDVLFDTANRIYDLGLQMKPIIAIQPAIPFMPSPQSSLAQFERFLGRNEGVKYLRFQWLDYTATLRVRVLSIQQAKRMLRELKYIGITKAVLGLQQTDSITEGFKATGEYNLVPAFDSLRLSARDGHATVLCEFQEKDGSEVTLCPRTVLRRQLRKCSEAGLAFLVGFEIEIIFMRPSITTATTNDDSHITFGETPLTAQGGHAWSTAQALQNNDIMTVIESIVSKLERAGIELLQFHPESAPGQYEFVLGPLPPAAAVDTLLAAREIVRQVAADAGLRATLYPKPFPQLGGTGAHIHLSMQPEDKWRCFYAGVLAHLRELSAVLYANEASYERVVDSAWAGSTWIAWGPQNRETPLRQIDETSHFEIKCSDGFANPYLSLAAILGAGLDGVAKDMPLEMKPCLDDPGKLGEEGRTALGVSEQFPKGLSEALDVFGKADFGEMFLDDEVVKAYVAVKREEHEFLQGMEPDRRRDWLIERY